MALGDGIRRNILTVSVQEQQRFVDAIVEINKRQYPGSRTDFPAGGVSQWFKMDEIHQATHVHGGAAFLPWHREICNYFGFLATFREAMRFAPIEPPDYTHQT